MEWTIYNLSKLTSTCTLFWHLWRLSERDGTKTSRLRRRVAKALLKNWYFWLPLDLQVLLFHHACWRKFTHARRTRARPLDERFGYEFALVHLMECSICPGFNTISCMPTSITVTKCPLTVLVHSTITCDEKWGKERSWTILLAISPTET